MDLEQLESLLTHEGQALLARAVAMEPGEATFLACHNKLSRLGAPALVRAALETALLRKKARAKFVRADRMFFTREALEQASSEPVSRHRARRFSGVVADLCCGIGGDALAMGQVVAVDRDPLRLAMAKLNVEAYGGRGEFVVGDVLTMDLPRCDGVFVDPDRRVNGRRVLSLRDGLPPVPDLLSRLPRGVPIGVKLAPGVPLADLAEFDAEAEFVSLGGELKECSLWLGPARGVTRRATLLPGGHTLTSEGAALPEAGEPLGFLYDPDPAIVRAGLVAELALGIGARPLDPTVAYLTSREAIETPFAKCYEVDAAMPFHLQRLREYLREHNIGRVQVTRRGSPVEPAELERKLKLKGDGFRTVVLTRVTGRPFVLVARASG